MLITKNWEVAEAKWGSAACCHESYITGENKIHSGMWNTAIFLKHESCDWEQHESFRKETKTTYYGMQIWKERAGFRKQRPTDVLWKKKPHRIARQRIHHWRREGIVWCIKNCFPEHHNATPNLKNSLSVMGHHFKTKESRSRKIKIPSWVNFSNESQVDLLMVLLYSGPAFPWQGWLVFRRHWSWLLTSDYMGGRPLPNCYPF